MTEEEAREYIWRVLRQDVTDGGCQLAAIGAKPTDEEPYFSVEFSDGFRMLIALQGDNK